MATTKDLEPGACLNLNGAAVIRWVASKTAPDIRIKCQGEELHAHRSVVCALSPFFNAALNGPFLEAGANSIDLDDDDPEAVKAMVGYMYHGKYCDFESILDPATLPLHAEVYVLADKYRYTQLMRHSKRAIERTIARHPACLSTLNFRQVVETVYGAPCPAKDNLRLTLTARTYRHSQHIPMDDPDTAQMFLENPQFAFDLAKEAIANA